MTREEIKTKGLEMTTNLGLEDKKVILFWEAFEEDRLLACWLLLKSWELSLRKQWELFFCGAVTALVRRIPRTYVLSIFWDSCGATRTGVRCPISGTDQRTRVRCAICTKTRPRFCVFYLLHFAVGVL